MTTTVHVLKTTSAYFDAVWSGEKTFEVRYDDRGYQRGHQVRLREFDPTITCEVCPREPGQPWHTGPYCQKYSGREIHADIGHVMATTPQASKTRPGFNGLGYVVFSLLNVGTFDRSATREADRVDELAKMLGIDVDPEPAAGVIAHPDISQRAADAIAALVDADRQLREPAVTPAEAARRMADAVDRRAREAIGGDES